MAVKTEKDESPIKLTVATAERQEVKTDSVLIYILPPLVVLAVFLYCMVADPDLPPPAAAPAAKPIEDIDMEEFSDEELDVDDEGETNEEES